MPSKFRESKFHKKIGKIGEELAISYIEKKGYKIIARNKRYKEGEIDIIFVDGDEIVFCEVKTRRYKTEFLPEYSINWKKVKALKEASIRFLVENNYENRNIRFDGIFIFYTFGTKFAIKKIEHIKDII
jgi:putative endonuclease